MSTFPRLLLDTYRQTPDQVALTLLLSGQQDQPITFRQLVEGAHQWAKKLERAGILPGEVVVLILQHGLDLVYAYWGTILYGGIPSILPFLTEKLLPERYRSDLAALVAITKPASIITYRQFEPEVRASLPENCSVRQVMISEDVHATQEVCLHDFHGLERKPEDIVLLQHSSGTTGLQKGVALSHQAVLNQLESYSLALKINAEDVIVSWLPLYHDMGLIAGFLMPILLRVPLVLLSPFDWVRSPVRLFQAVKKYHGTLSWLPNFAYNFCAQKIRDRELEDIDLSSWRAISNCSEPMRFESHQAFLARFSKYGLKESALCSCYAMAENVFAVTQGGISSPVLIDEVDRESLQNNNYALPRKGVSSSLKMVSAGLPINNVSIRVLDPHGNSLPDRNVGEFAFKSNCMLTDYYHRADATKKAIQRGWYLTGDMGYLLDGQVFIAGRKKDMIIVGGKNIFPMDLEELAMEVSGVHAGRVVAFGVFNEETGTEDVVIVAEVDTPEEKEREIIGDMIRQTVTRGSAVALRHVYLVDALWLIKTSSGKTARGANKEKYLKEITF
ncbi:MAG: AMP-binding protein [Chloroflexi bacterium]|nr:AMP-binding protein [Chloroflexota bacterium]